MMRLFSGPCPVCGGEELSTSSVLWSELIKLSEYSDFLDKNSLKPIIHKIDWTGVYWRKEQ